VAFHWLWSISEENAVSVRGVALLLLLLLCAWGASASDRQSLLKEYGDALGVEEMISSSKHATEQMVASSGERVLENFRQSGMSEDAIAQAGLLYQDVMKEVLGSWTAAEASRIYTEALAASMSDADLRAAIDFYKSTEGRRAYAATNTRQPSSSRIFRTQRRGHCRPRWLIFLRGWLLWSLQT
jgi:hypothetical protein